jgi:ribonucleoside-diphosphate reductase alpha chain
MKSLYYCRSLSIQRADNVSEQAERPSEIVASPTDYSECLSCQ